MNSFNQMQPYAIESNPSGEPGDGMALALLLYITAPSVVLAAAAGTIYGAVRGESKLNSALVGAGAAAIIPATLMTVTIAMELTRRLSYSDERRHLPRAPLSPPQAAQYPPVPQIHQPLDNIAAAPQPWPPQSQPVPASVQQQENTASFQNTLHTQSIPR